MTTTLKKTPKIWHLLPTKTKLDKVWFEKEGDAEWVAAKTVGDGNCGVDAVCIALGLPRTKDMYMALRGKIARRLLEQGAIDFETVNPVLVAEADAIRKNKSWLADDDIYKLLCNDNYQIVPIILDGEYSVEASDRFNALSDEKREAAIARYNKKCIAASENDEPCPASLPFQHQPFLGYFGSAAAIAKRRHRDKDLTAYIVLKHVSATHWICLGQQSESEASPRTIFMENELPRGLLAVFLAYVQTGLSGHEKRD